MGDHRYCQRDCKSIHDTELKGLGLAPHMCERHGMGAVGSRTRDCFGCAASKTILRLRRKARVVLTGEEIELVEDVRRVLADPDMSPPWNWVELLAIIDRVTEGSNERQRRPI